MQKIGILGAGAFGTAMAEVSARALPAAATIGCPDTDVGADLDEIIHGLLSRPLVFE